MWDLGSVGAIELNCFGVGTWSLCWPAAAPGWNNVIECLCFVLINTAIIGILIRKVQFRSDAAKKKDLPHNIHTEFKQPSALKMDLQCDAFVCKTNTFKCNYLTDHTFTLKYSTQNTTSIITRTPQALAIDRNLGTATKQQLLNYFIKRSLLFVWRIISQSLVWSQKKITWTGGMGRGLHQAGHELKPRAHAHTPFERQEWLTALSQ